VSHILAHQSIDHGCDRDAKQHTDKSKQSSAHRNRRKYPKSGQADGGSHNTGIDDISLKLLKDKQEHHKPNRLHGVDHNQKKECDSGSDIGAGFPAVGKGQDHVRQQKRQGRRREKDRQPSAAGVFRLGEFIITDKDFCVGPTTKRKLNMDIPPVDEFRLVSLPVKRMENFGEWLNVSWDETAAVNVLGVSPYAVIDSERRKGYRVMTADVRRDLKLKNCTVALIATAANELMDAIDQLEQENDRNSM
jgi:hypothetical protein